MLLKLESTFRLDCHKAAIWNRISELYLDVYCSVTGFDFFLCQIHKHRDSLFSKKKKDFKRHSRIYFPKDILFVTISTMLVSVVWDFLNQKESQNKKYLLEMSTKKYIHVHVYASNCMARFNAEFFCLNIFFLQLLLWKACCVIILYFCLPIHLQIDSQISHFSMFFHSAWLNKIFRFLHSKSNHVVTRI